MYLIYLWMLWRCLKIRMKKNLARTAAIQQAYKDAANVPLEIGMISYEIFDLAYVAATKGNQNLITDGIIAAINARAAVKGGVFKRAYQYIWH